MKVTQEQMLRALTKTLDEITWIDIYQGEDAPPTEVWGRAQPGAYHTTVAERLTHFLNEVLDAETKTQERDAQR